MIPPATLKDRFEGIFTKKSNPEAGKTSGRPRILVATTDPEIRRNLAELLKDFSIDTIWLKGVEAAKAILAKETISACLCGFWLQDGTCRQLLRHIRRERINIPVIVLTAPSHSDEYRDILAALRIEAIDFLSYPDRTGELERILQSATGSDVASKDPQASAVAPAQYADGMA